MADPSKANTNVDSSSAFPAAAVEALVAALGNGRAAAAKAGAERILLREFDKVIRELTRAQRLSIAALEHLRVLSSARAKTAATSAKKLVTGFAKDHEAAIGRAADEVLGA